MQAIIEELEEGFMPVKATAGSVGYDLMSRIRMTIDPGMMGVIPTGIKIQLPEGYEVQIRPRSGIAKKCIIIPNSPGTIDSDYRGEICVLLFNLGETAYGVEYKNRIAQMVFNKVELPELMLGKIDNTERGEGGFGSTGD